jgi:hypothetical protein
MSNAEIIFPLITFGLSFLFGYLCLKFRPKFTRSNGELIEEVGDEALYILFLHLCLIFINSSLYSLKLIVPLVGMESLTSFSNTLFYGFTTVNTFFGIIFWVTFFFNKTAKAGGAYDEDE